jgi:hypothetical protein
VLLAGFIAGTADILAAIFILAKGKALLVLKYVASGFFGHEAMKGGNDIAVYGLLFHFFIAYSWVSFYFLIYPYVHFLRKSIWLSSPIYGLFVWAVMAFAVVPLTKIPPAAHFNVSNAVLNAVILMFTIGLPASYFTAKYNQAK